VLDAHFAELHDLPSEAAAGFLADLQHASRAVQRASGAVKINLLSLGNLVPHVHFHICPRTPGDRLVDRPLDMGDVTDSVYSDASYAAYCAALKAALIATC